MTSTAKPLSSISATAAPRGAPRRSSQSTTGTNNATLLNKSTLVPADVTALTSKIAGYAVPSGSYTNWDAGLWPAPASRLSMPGICPRIPLSLESVSATVASLRSFNQKRTMCRIILVASCNHGFCVIIHGRGALVEGGASFYRGGAAE